MNIHILTRFKVMILVLSCSTLLLANDLSVERLTWAGIKIKYNNTTVFVDAVGTDIWEGKAPEKFVPVSADTNRRYALVTHMHNDHFDAATLENILGEKGYVICHESSASHIASRGLKVIPAEMYTPVIRGGMVFTAVPAEDGLGDNQVSWIIAAEEKRIFHGGDTLWHGKWSTIGLQYGPFDVAFLPINGARFGDGSGSETPFVMTPSQAVDAAKALKAKLLVPIHFGLNDEFYLESDNALEQAISIADRRNLRLEHIKPGEHVNWVTN